MLGKLSIIIFYCCCCVFRPTTLNLNDVGEEHATSAENEAKIGGRPTSAKIMCLLYKVMKCCKQQKIILPAQMQPIDTVDIFYSLPIVLL